jgi:hypothetical protein
VVLEGNRDGGDVIRVGVQVQSRDRIVWRRRPPKRAAVRLGWTALAAGFVCGPTWLLFGGESLRASEGALNPLALIIPALAALFAVLFVPQVLGLFRRPIVAADHYALTVRPGAGRTLVMPWAQLAELCTVQVDEEPVLLIRCGVRRVSSADWPRWWDQGLLRSARRSRVDEPIAAYDLAVSMSDFVGAPDNLLNALAAWAPDHVVVLSKIE